MTMWRIVLVCPAELVAARTAWLVELASKHGGVTVTHHEGYWLDADKRLQAERSESWEIASDDARSWDYWQSIAACVAESLDQECVLLVEGGCRAELVYAQKAS